MKITRKTEEEAGKNKNEAININRSLRGLKEIQESVVACWKLTRNMSKKA